MTEGAKGAENGNGEANIEITCNHLSQMDLSLKTADMPVLPYMFEVCA